MRRDSLLHFVAGEHVMLSSTFHFWAVGASALLATLAGFTLSYAGWRKQDPRAVLVGTAFSVMAALLVVHGFASPGVVVARNGVVAFTGAATLPVGGARCAPCCSCADAPTCSSSRASSGSRPRSCRR